MRNKFKFGVLIVTYNPSERFYDLVNYFVKEEVQIVIIDNSDNKNLVIEKIKLNSKIKLIKNEKNYGIAKSLNKGIKLLDENIEYFFTFDQDSVPSDNFLKSFYKYLNYRKDIGILVPTILDNNTKSIVQKEKINFNLEIEEVDMAIQSGMLINKKAYFDVNGFNENLVIYYVDNEFVHKIKEKKYKIFRLNKSFLIHNDGNLQKKNIFFKVLYFNERSKVAIYFRSKNLIYMCHNYGWIYIKDLVYDIITNLFFSKDRKIFFYYMFKGLKDTNKKINFIDKNMFKRR